MVNLYLRIKFFILNIITRFLSKNISVERRNVGLSKAITVGVLYRYETPAKHEIVQRFIRDLKNLDKKVSVLCYTTAKDRTFPSSNLLYAFEEKVITMLGSIKSDRVKKFVENPFDYLFHVDIETNPILDYILVKNRAKCRIGYFDPKRKVLFEMMVKVKLTHTKDDIKRLTTQMLHYTKCMEVE